MKKINHNIYVVSSQNSFEYTFIYTYIQQMVKVMKSGGMLKFKLHWLKFDETIGITRLQTFLRDRAN